MTTHVAEGAHSPHYEGKGRLIAVFFDYCLGGQ